MYHSIWIDILKSAYPFPIKTQNNYALSPYFGSIGVVIYNTKYINIIP